jgi:hypothetical protein
MRMLLIKGFYDIKGSQPDGDTVHFTADDPAEWSLVGGRLGRAVEHSVTGRAKLRLDAIDALGTHYGANRVHQPLQFAHAARDELLGWLGFTDVQRGPDEGVTATTPGHGSRVRPHPAVPMSTVAASPWRAVSRPPPCRGDRERPDRRDAASPEDLLFEDA